MMRTSEVGPLAWFSRHASSSSPAVAGRRPGILVRRGAPGDRRRDLRVEYLREQPSPAARAAGAKPDARSGAAAVAGPARPRARTRPGRPAPVYIPWRGWKDISVRTYQESMNDRLFLLAAERRVLLIVALFPAIAAGVSSYALFADASMIGKHLAIASDIIPQGALDLLQGEITRIASKSDGRLTFGFLVGFGIALWSANAGMKAIFDALNIIYDEEEKRGLIWLNVESLFFTVCAIAVPVAGAGRRGGVSAVSRDVRPVQHGRAADRYPALAGDVSAGGVRRLGTVPLRAEPAAAEMAMDHRRQRVRGVRLARRIVAVFVLPRRTSPTTTRPTARSAPWSA